MRQLGFVGILELRRTLTRFNRSIYALEYPSYLYIVRLLKIINNYVPDVPKSEQPWGKLLQDYYSSGY
jgi:hypothetical protein